DRLLTSTGPSSAPPSHRGASHSCRRLARGAARRAAPTPPLGGWFDPRPPTGALRPVLLTVREDATAALTPPVRHHVRGAAEKGRVEHGKQAKAGCAAARGRSARADRGDRLDRCERQREREWPGQRERPEQEQRPEPEEGQQPGR